MRIIAAKGVPDADASITEYWQDAIKARQPFVWIHYSETRDTSRWKSVPRARKFLVEHVDHRRSLTWLRVGEYKTLQQAIAGAQAWVKSIDQQGETA